MPAEPLDLIEFRDAYIECMLWAETDDDGKPLDRNYSASDIAPETLEAITSDCRGFLEANRADLDRCEEMKAEGEWSNPGRCSVIAYAGHDFWLTRVGHGCGFWDGDWPDEIGDRLDQSAKQAGERWVYVGDDGLIYLSK